MLHILNAASNFLQSLLVGCFWIMLFCHGVKKKKLPLRLLLFHHHQSLEENNNGIKQRETLADFFLSQPVDSHSLSVVLGDDAEQNTPYVRFVIFYSPLRWHVRDASWAVMEKARLR